MENRTSILGDSSHYAMALNAISEGVFIVDRDMVLTFFNRAAEKIMGLKASEVIGCSVYDVMCLLDSCPIAGLLNETLRTGKPQEAPVIRITNRKKNSLPISITTLALRDEDGEVIGGVSVFRDESTVETLRKEVHGRYTFQDIVSANHQIRRLFDILPDVSATDSTILIEGPTGSGKELFAHAIHNLSLRAQGPFVAVNCGALPDTLLESELFGFVKGAFTGAVADKKGRFSLADKGTIFLDEIGDISTALQVKLLRVLQEREFEPLGGTKTIKADVRVITATNKNLRDEVAHGRFREDLYYRLNIVRLSLPPLSERREDIPLLVEHFIARFNAKTGKTIQGVSDKVLSLLIRYDFPGNVRELGNIIEYAFALCREAHIQLLHLPADFTARAHLFSVDTVSPEIPNDLVQAEIDAIQQALERHHGNRSRAAADLGIDRTTLWRKMRRHGIETPTS